MHFEWKPSFNRRCELSFRVVLDLYIRGFLPINFLCDGFEQWKENRNAFKLFRQQKSKCEAGFDTSQQSVHQVVR
jgi:hypothetical protein